MPEDPMIASSPQTAAAIDRYVIRLVCAALAMALAMLSMRIAELVLPI